MTETESTIKQHVMQKMNDLGVTEIEGERARVWRQTVAMVLHLTRFNEITVPVLPRGSWPQGSPLGADRDRRRA